MNYDVSTYKPSVAWRTYFKNVLLYSTATELDPAIYSMEVQPVDINELGAPEEEKEVGYYVADYVGNVYRIIYVSGRNIRVSDDFRFGQMPTTGLQGVVYKSAYGGLSPYVAPIFSKHLGKTALDKIRSIDVSILWHTREKVEFTNTRMPSIIDYQDKYAFVYGEFPDVTLMVEREVGVEWELQQVPVRNYVAGKLDSIVWDLPEELSGYIIISR